MSDAPVNNVIKRGGSDAAESAVLPFNNTYGVFALYGRATSLGTAQVLYRDGVAYQVGAGVSLEIIEIRLSSSTASDRVQLLSDDTAFAPGAALASLNAPIYQGGAVNCYVMGIVSSNVPSHYKTPFVVAQNRFLGFDASASGFEVCILAREV